MENEAVTHMPGEWKFDLGNGLNVSLLQELLPPMTQDESATKTFYDGFQTASVQDIFLIGGRLYELKDAEGKAGHAVKSAREFIKREIRSHWLNTQTRIRYQSAEKDTII